jgi:Spy/CpxP family protein refolding chaperone
MKRMKKSVVLVLALLTVAAVTTAVFAAQSPQEALAELTGRSAEELRQERASSGRSFGAMAKEADLLEEFKLKMFELKKQRISERVAAGEITREQADDMIRQIETRQAECNGDAAGAGGIGGFGIKSKGFRQGGSDNAGRAGLGMARRMRDGSACAAK